MNTRPDCVAIIPCLNEERTIFALVRAVRKHVGQIVVIDDGSIDATAALAKEAGAEVIRHAQPRGKGAALNTGWRWALANGFEWALAMDGDGQHDPADIPQFFSAANHGDADLIVGNRFQNAASMPWLRRKVNQWMSKRLSLAGGIPLPDSQCGFRLMRLSAWARVTLETEHFEVESEVLLAFVSNGYGIRFVPVRTIYSTERSKIHPVRDTVRWFKWWKRVGTMRGQIPIAAMTAKQKIHAAYCGGTSSR